MTEGGEARAERLCVKGAFYADLDSMLQSDNEDDPGRTQSMSKLQKGRTTQAAMKQKSVRNNIISRSLSDTDVLGKDLKLAIPSSSIQIGRPSTSNSAEQHAALTKRKTMHHSCKRKRGENLKLVEEGRQVFKGLHFYFFPNNNQNPARKMRINKTLEHGAIWESEWCDTVTHIIVDQALNFSLVAKHLKMVSIPAHIAVVTEDYPAQCIAWNALIDPDQFRFKVNGYIQPTLASKDLVQEAATPFFTSSDKPDQPRSVGNNVQIGLLDTPQTEDEMASGLATPHTLLVPLTAEESDVPDVGFSSGPKATAPLDHAIARVKALQTLPLDEEEDGNSRPSTSDGLDPDSDSEEEGEMKQKTKTKTNMRKIQNNFQCMQKNTGEKSGNPNDTIIDILQQMADYYENMKDQWRIRAYRQAISSLRKTNKKIRTKEQALTLPRIGSRIAEKIEEIATTDRLRRLDNALNETGNQALQTFVKVYGAGLSAARKWVDQGYTTLDELLQKASLTHNQRTGIEHYEDFNSRIPRAEVEQHGNVVKHALQEIDKSFDVVIGGSYRRGSQDSGDIDCLITHPTHTLATIRATVLDQLIPGLTHTGFFVAALSETSRVDGSKWHGASCLPPKDGQPSPWRRIDLLLVPAEQLGAALIYFTGNDIFNRSMRLLASTKGMRLNQRGLYSEVLRGKRRVKLTGGTLVEGRDERKIFETLGVPWRPPEHRIC